MRRIGLCLLAGTLAMGSGRAQVSPEAQQWFAQGLQALHDRQTKRAEGCFRRILTLQPPPEREYVTGAWTNLGVIAMQQKRWSAALADLEHARQLAPAVPGIRFNIGLSHFYQGSYEQAISAFASVLRDQPDSPQAHYFLGVCDFMTERYAQARTMLAPLWNREQNNISYLYMLALAAGKSGDGNWHQKALTQLLTTGAGRPELDLIRGRAELNTNQLPVAIASLERAAKLDPRLPYVHFSLGQAYQAQHQYEQARTEFQQDLAIGGNDADDEESLGQIDLIQGHLTDAETEFRRALALHPNQAAAHAGLGKLKLQEEDFEQALDEFTILCKLLPQAPEAHYLRGRALMKLHREQEAAMEFAASNRLQAEQLQVAHDKIAGPLQH